jgi:hypothetical protein
MWNSVVTSRGMATEHGTELNGTQIKEGAPYV